MRERARTAKPARKARERVGLLFGLLFFSLGKGKVTRSPRAINRSALKLSRPRDTIAISDRKPEPASHDTYAP